MNIAEILEFLPHRYPFLLVDRVVSCEAGKIVALKNVTVNEQFFQGHFPRHPVMPGVLIIEAMAQAAAILAFHTMQRKPGDSSVVYFAGIDEARFKRPVMPGDQLSMEVEVLRVLKGLWKFKAVAKVEQQLVAEATLLSTEKFLA